MINYARLVRGARGVKSQAEENASHGWLSDGEVEVVIDYIIELGNCGFPLSHWRLKEHVDEILWAQLGNKFPSGGVGIQWTHSSVAMAWLAVSRLLKLWLIKLLARCFKA